MIEVIDLLSEDENEVIEIDSSPVRPIRPAPRSKKDTTLLDKLIEFSDEEPLFVPDSSFNQQISKQIKDTTPKQSKQVSKAKEISKNVSIPSKDLFNNVSNDTSDDEVQISNHNIILSSSPMKYSKVDVDESIESIEIRPYHSPIKPLISIDKLKPIYTFDKSNEESNTDNPFLNKLLTKSAKDRLNHEQLIKKRSINKEKEVNWGDYTFEDDISSEPIAKTSTKTSTRPSTEPSKDNQSTKRHSQPLSKEDQKRHKQVNRVSRSKTELLDEMIIDAPKSFMDQVRTKQCIDQFDSIQVKESHKLDSFIHWQRKSTSTYDALTDCFIPSDPHVIDEDKCCFVFNANELIQMMEMETLLNTFTKFKRDNKKFKNFIIIIIEYEQSLNKLKNKENRKYADKVRGTTTKNTTDSISLTELQDTIAQLQVHGFKIFPTKTIHETCIWLTSFTYAIAQSRYDKLERNPEFSNIGIIRSGKSMQDTYTQMLLQLKFMTEPRVKRVLQVIPTFKELYDHVQLGQLPIGNDGKTIMNSNVQSVVMRLLKTRDDNELIHED